MGLWGVVLWVQEAIMRAAIADLTTIERRGFAYGIFNTAYGAGWGLGGAVMGLLYELFIDYLILFAWSWRSSRFRYSSWSKEQLSMLPERKLEENLWNLNRI